MPSLSKPFLICVANLVFILLFLSPSSIQGASLREHRLRGSESDSPRGNLPRDANVDMLKALEYIESLRQQSGRDSKQLTPGHNATRTDDNERLLAMLRLGSNPGQSQDEDEQEEEEEDKEDMGKEDKSEELLEAVLDALQQTEKDGEPESRPPSAARGFPSEGAGIGSKPGMNPRWNQKPRGGITPHKKLPLMFEDEEEGEGDDEDEEHKSPFKRTKENVEEKYTPQNLATLQSVFEELGKMTSAKATHKRQQEEDDGEEEDKEEEDDEDDGFNIRDADYNDDGADFEDWDPQPEEEEEEDEEDEDEEERNNGHEDNRGMDYFNDEDEEGDNEKDEESYLIKRSSISDPQKYQDDIANLVDYYLLKVLEKTEEEEQKRELEEEKERTERRASQRKDTIDPRLIYQLLQISQKYQIPPEDLMDMMKMSNQDKVPLSPSRKNSELARAEDRFSQMSSKKTHKNPGMKSYRRLPDRQNPKIPEDPRIEEMLKILGLGENTDQAPLRKQNQYKSSVLRLHSPPSKPSGDYIPTQRFNPNKLKHDYDEDEDELATYLAAEMLSRYPKQVHKIKAGQKRDEAGQTAPGLFEQALQDYFDQMGSDQSQTPKIQSNISGKGSDSQMQGWDNDAVMKLLSYMNPESKDSEDDAKEK